MVAPNPSMLEVALAHARRGWAVFPLAPGSKVPLIPKKDGGNGCLDGTRDEPRILGWFTSTPEANVGIATGAASNLLGLDVDGAAGEASLARLEAQHGALPRTARVRTRRGFHYYFRHVPGLKNRAAILSKESGLDIRTDGGYLVAPGSVVDGHTYTLEDEPVDEAPTWLVALLPKKVEPKERRPAQQRQAPVRTAGSGFSAYGRKAVDAEVARLRQAPEGSRNDTLNGVAFNLGQLCAGGEIADLAQSLVDLGVEIGLSEAECRKTVASAWRAGMTKPRSAPPRADRPPLRALPRDDQHDVGAPDGAEPARDDDGPPEEPPEDREPDDAPTHELETDLGNARRLVRLHGEDLFHTGSLGWLVWDGTRWQRDETGDAVRRAKAAIESLWGEAKKAADRGDTESAKHKFKHALKSQSARSIEAALRLASTEKSVAARTESFDRHPWLLNCRNGVLDLKTGRMQEHDQALRLTRRVEASFHPNASCPQWEEFLEQVLPDPEVRSFLQRYAGYTLAGERAEQVFVFLYGSGSNGKSTLLDVLASVLGDYGVVTPFDTFLERQPGQATNDLARLAGSRFVRASEPDEGAVFSESLVKSITGGEPISARFHRQEFFEFVPGFTLWLSGNHHPRVKGTDEGIWRRVLLVPFSVRIEKGDKHLKDRLLDERDGILRWMYEGCAAWQRVGLNAPKAVVKATTEYRKDQDVAGRFLEERCILTLKEADWLTVKALRGAYEHWCDENGERPMSQRALADRLKLRGLNNARMAGTGATIWTGLRWREGASQSTLEMPIEEPDL